MVKKIIATLIIAALFFSAAGVMAEDSGGDSGSSDSGGSDSSSDSSDDSSSDSGSSSSDDSSSGSDHSISPGTTSGSDHSGSDDSSHVSESPGSDNSHDSPDTSSDSPDHAPGVSSSSGSPDDSPDHSSSSGSSSDSPDSAENEMEIEIEHGISTITSHESESRVSGSVSDSSSETRVAAESLVSLKAVPGTAAPELASMATSIENSLDHLSVSENAIKSRSGIMTFFFGGDDAAATEIETRVSEDLATLDKMDRILADPSTSPALKTFTKQREDTIRAELMRLQGVAASEKQKKGIFG